ncbi:hypothetical protein ACFQO4_01715 [Saliphagus sp. GCM10025334]
MTGNSTEADATTSPPSRAEAPSISIDGVRTHLLCPQRYRYAHEYGLHTGEDEPQVGRLELLRTAICDALRAGDVDTLETRALDRFADRWADYGEGVHSRAQRRHERRVLEAAIRAYVEVIGTDHAEYLYATRAGGVDGELVGPDLPLRSTVTATRTTADDDEASLLQIDVPIDYAVLEGSSFVGVRFVPTAAHLGILRYRSAWDGDVADRFAGHFDPDRAEFAPELVATLLETAAALDGLRTLRDRLSLTEARTCRYVQVPILDRDRLTVNPLRERVETSVEPVDLTEPYLDHHTFGMTHEHRNQTVDDRLRQVATAAIAGVDEEAFESRWDRIKRDVCPTCPYAVCCTKYLSSEVAFDG